MGNPYLPGGYKEYYIRDAQGNIMAMYRYTNSGPASLQVTERPLYGSGRVGSYAEAQQLLPATAVPANYVHPMLPAHTRYELADHLGNVRATVSGQLLPGNNAGSPYQPELVSAQGYEPFGSLLPGRNYSSDSYRWGFNGKENDDEVFGARGTFQDYGFRMYDTRTARFISVDPLRSKFPYYTPYQFAGNSPVKFIDLDGLEPAESNNPNLKGKEGRMWAANYGYEKTGGDAKFLGSGPTEENGFFVKTPDPSKFISNNPEDPFGRFVNTNSQFVVTNENAYNTEADLVNEMLGNFMWGIGPENYVFPENGKFSNVWKESIAVGEALSAWSKAGKSDGIFGWDMDLRGQTNVFAAHGSVTNLEQFSGSVTTRISKIDADHIRVEIFNITSLTSGDLTKDLTRGIVSPLISLPRDGSNGTQLDHTNSSQYYSLTMSTSEADKLIKRFTPPSNNK